MPAALLSVLKGIGLSISETIVLGMLLKEGPLTAAQIAKAARMKRPTTYDTLKELAQKGLVNEIRDRAVLQFEAIDPDLLPNYVARKRADLEKKEGELRQALNDLREMKKGKHVPLVHIEEGPRATPFSLGAKRLSTILPETTSHGVDVILQEKTVLFEKDAETHPVTVSIEDAFICQTMRELFARLEKNP